MGKGGLSFLNKKSWHTATIANAEKVWLAEQKDAAEKSKLAQLQKEIAEERQVEELLALQRRHGIGQKPVERLDWMYRSAEIEAEMKQKEQEEFLRGKPIPASSLAPDPAKPVGIETVTASGTERWVKKYEQRDLDAESRIREDPMLMILKQEQEQRLSILKNPLQMKRIREEVDKKKLLKKLKKMEKEESKKLKKLEKKQKKKAKEDNDRKTSPSRYRSPSRDAKPSEVDKYGLIQPRAAHWSSDDRHARSTPPSDDRRRRRHSRDRSRSPSAVKRRRRDSPDRDDRRRNGKRDDKSDDCRRDDNRENNRDDRIRDGSRHPDKRDDKRDESRRDDKRDDRRDCSRHDDKRDDKRGGSRQPDKRDDKCDDHRRDDKRDDKRGDRREYSRHDGKRDDKHDDRRCDDRRVDRRRHDSPANERRRRSPSPEADRLQETKNSGESKDAKELRLEALRSRIGNRLKRQRDVASSTASKLTPEEREARLRAMAGDAQHQHEIRSQQLAIDVEEQKREEEALRMRDANAGHNAEFIQKLNKQAFLESSDTVEDRIKQRVHYRQKGSTEHHSFL